MNYDSYVLKCDVKLSTLIDNYVKWRKMNYWSVVVSLLCHMLPAWMVTSVLFIAVEDDVLHGFLSSTVIWAIILFMLSSVAYYRTSRDLTLVGVYGKHNDWKQFLQHTKDTEFDTLYKTSVVYVILYGKVLGVTDMEGELTLFYSVGQGLRLITLCKTPEQKFTIVTLSDNGEFKFE